MICACKILNLVLNLGICLYDVRVLIGFGFLFILHDQFISYKLMNLTADITTQVLSHLTFTFALNHFAILLSSVRGKWFCSHLYFQFLCCFKDTELRLIYIKSIIFSVLVFTVVISSVKIWVTSEAAEDWESWKNSKISKCCINLQYSVLLLNFENLAFCYFEKYIQ